MSVDSNSLDNSPEDEPVNAIVQLNPQTTKTFEAGGKKYYVELLTLSAGRYKHFQKMELELGFSINFPGLVDKLKEAYTALNARRDADAAVTIMQTLDGCRLFNEDRQAISLYVATLFINTADEDRSKWSKSLADQKIEDWSNIDANFFLSLALAQVRQFPEKYKELSEMLTRVSAVKSSILDES